MKERPIIFSTEMVKAILDGRKTMTRRVVKPQPGLTITDEIYKANIQKLIEGGDKVCPYGQVGDRLWVRETHYRYGRWAKNGWSKTGKQAWKFLGTTDQVRYMDNPPEKIWDGWTREELNSRGHSDWHKRPSIFMPRWASRLTLEITEVRVERLQEITEEDAQAEGVLWCREGATPDARHHFMVLWNSLNAKRGYGWDTNPWVWVIKFDNIGVRVK